MNGAGEKPSGQFPPNNNGNGRDLRDKVIGLIKDNEHLEKELKNYVTVVDFEKFKSSFYRWLLLLGGGIILALLRLFWPLISALSSS